VRRAEGFGLTAESVDGQDVAAVWRAVSAAAERARSGGGPSFIEARTYRYEGHNTGQIITYRTDDEVAEWRLKDPINRFSAALVDAGILGESDVAAADEKVMAQVDEAVAFAEASPPPDTATADTGVTSLPLDAWKTA
jgi:pyruvate dehydrogenase E1 component alpha subunit